MQHKPYFRASACPLLIPASYFPLLSDPSPELTDCVQAIVHGIPEHYRHWSEVACQALMGLR